MTYKISPAFIPPISLQLAHLLLSIVWNIVGVILINKGHAALGPTASLVSALIMTLLIAMLTISASRARWLYVCLSVFILYVSLSTINNAMVSDPGLWPSEFWRYAGMAINGLGVGGAVWGLYLCYTSLINPNQRSD